MNQQNYNCLCNQIQWDKEAPIALNHPQVPDTSIRDPEQTPDNGKQTSGWARASACVRAVRVSLSPIFLLPLPPPFLARSPFSRFQSWFWAVFRWTEEPKEGLGKSSIIVGGWQNFLLLIWTTSVTFCKSVPFSVILSVNVFSIVFPMYFTIVLHLQSKQGVLPRTMYLKKPTSCWVLVCLNQR